MSSLLVGRRPLSGNHDHTAHCISFRGHQLKTMLKLGSLKEPQKDLFQIFQPNTVKQTYNEVPGTGDFASS